MDAVHRGDLDSSTVGKSVILPSSHTGGPRYRAQNYQDAMAICRSVGYQDLFITFTCNPKWLEINDMLGLIGQKDDRNRVDIVCRVFEIKLQQLIHYIKKEQPFGEIMACLYTIELQKRGLPHAHILLFLHPSWKNPSPEYMDTIISAEFPDINTDPDAYYAVKKSMLHGPCGHGNTSSPCIYQHVRLAGESFSLASTTSTHQLNAYLSTHLVKDSDEVYDPGIELGYFTDEKLKSSLHEFTLSEETKVEDFVSVENVEDLIADYHVLHVATTSSLDEKDEPVTKEAMIEKHEERQSLVEKVLVVEKDQIDASPKFMRDDIVDGQEILKEKFETKEKLDKSLKDIDGMPQFNSSLTRDIGNILLNEELNYDRADLNILHEKSLHALNHHQKIAYDAIVHSVQHDKGKLFFISGHGGTGKTFLWNTITSKLRSDSMIVLPVATSGIASLLLPNGRTTHSRFCISLDVTVESTSLDKSLRDILSTRYEDSRSKPFGGLTVVCGGDFLQILPVIPQGERADVIDASLNTEYEAA
ncbi:uncharacterized protein LOC141665999 [Apium graveolens]|uniref:uncharacterized protein LOC141665999 n=1 Tax=Apium graveolens TaxID=4045 RepID=UPI003D7B5E70